MFQYSPGYNPSENKYEPEDCTARQHGGQLLLKEQQEDFVSKVLVKLPAENGRIKLVVWRFNHQTGGFTGGDYYHGYKYKSDADALIRAVEAFKRR